MTNAETIQTAIKHKVDYLGFVFYPKSPRNLTPDQAKELTKNIPQNVKRIAVLVNAKDEFIEQIKDYFDNFFIEFLSYLFNSFYIFIAV